MSKSIKTKQLAQNTFSSLTLQVCTIICGFILPRMILKFYGSEVNGLVNSITQFLQVIGFLDFGVGAVVQSSLYKPLVEKDNKKINEIVVSASRFFRHVGVILLVYVIILIFLYPYISKHSFNHMYSAVLICSMCINSFAQYYFGVVDRLLLTADQRGYIQYNVQIITLIVNTLVCAFLIYNGHSIQVVKLMTSLIFLLRPIYLRWYVNSHYTIDRKLKYVGEPIKQKWNGMAQHISAIVLDGTDSIVLTVFATLSDVSIYSVYHLIVYGVKSLFTSMTNGIQSILGELWAIHDNKKLFSVFGWIEWIIHTTVVLIFGCTSILIIPFVKIYTLGISDAEYIQPIFSIVIVLAHATHCIRLPYHMLIKAAGRYKESQNCYMISTLLNTIISIVCVKTYGLIGVAIGTFIAMLYQTIWMVIYNSKHLLCWSLKHSIKQIGIDILSVTICVLLTSWIKLTSVSYTGWFLLAMKVFVMWCFALLIINLIFYKDKIIFLCNKIKVKKLYK